jgi:CheY-like chemotaxis protein
MGSLAIEGLLQTLGHEVRQALHHVLASVDAVLEEPVSTLQATELSQCRDAAGRLLRTCNDVAELADPAPAVVSLETCDLSALLDGVMELVAPGAARRGLDLSCAVAPQAPRHVLTDRRLMESVLYRVLDACVRRTTCRGLNVAADVEPSEVEPADGEPADVRSAQLQIRVWDTGPSTPDAGDGEPPISRIEDLGVQVAKKQLDALGGTLDIDMDARGAFVLTLTAPVRAEKSPRAPARGTAAPESFRGRPLRLLVAEDCEESFNVFRAYVSGEGHQVTRALDGVEAVEMFKTGDFDLVVMDVDMPSADGYTATRLIREWETRQGRARLPIVLLSADSASRQLRLGAASGCSGYLSKPTPKADLLRALRHYAGIAGIRSV